MDGSIHLLHGTYPIQTLSRELMFKVDPDLKPQIAKWAAFYVSAFALTIVCTSTYAENDSAAKVFSMNDHSQPAKIPMLIGLVLCPLYTTLYYTITCPPKILPTSHSDSLAGAPDGAGIQTDFPSGGILCQMHVHLQDLLAAVVRFLNGLFCYPGEEDRSIRK